jgi:hypothetical protein
MRGHTVGLRKKEAAGAGRRTVCVVYVFARQGGTRRNRSGRRKPRSIGVAALDGAVAGAVSRWDGRVRANLASLAYPRIAEQLHAVPLDAAVPPAPREVAAAAFKMTPRVALIIEVILAEVCEEGVDRRRSVPTSGSSGRRPRVGLGYGTLHAALNGLALAPEIELTPARVNAGSPGGIGIGRTR